jgi:hypothetical protein
VSAAAKGGDPGGSNPWLAVAIVCIVQAMVVLDATIVNVALPSIQRGLIVLFRERRCSMASLSHPGC